MKTKFMQIVFSIFLFLLLSLANVFAQSTDTTDPHINYHRTENKNLPSTTYTQFPKEQVFPLGWNTAGLEKVNSGTGVWKELNPGVPRVDYYGVYFKDELNGFAVGEFGAIIKTTDGGLSWIDQTYSTDRTLLRIYGSENFVIIVGVAGTIIITTNFGENWEQINLQTYQDIWGVYVFNDSTGFICAKDGNLFKTTNAGNSWQKDSIEYQLAYWDMQFMNADTGFISCSNGIILKTTNGGNTWSQKSTGDFSSLYSIEILPDKKIVTAGSSGKIYYSTDFGNTFNQSIVPVNLLVEDLGFANNDIGYVVGPAAFGGVNKTTDGGITWFLIHLGMGNLNVDFVSDSIGYTVGADLIVDKSTDQGKSWIQQILNENLTSISTPNDSISYFLGWSHLYKYSLDELIDFKTIPPGSEEKIFFLTEQIGHLADTNGDIYKTENGGNKWVKTDSTPTPVPVYKIEFINPFLGWYISETYLKRTINGGNNWEQFFNSSDFNNFYFLDSLNGWIVAAGKTYKTSDGGDNWEIINTSFSFNDIVFKNIDTGFAVNGSVYKTTDGGYNWQLVNGATGYYIQLVDSSMLITWKSDGAVFMSPDEGASWNQYDLPDRNFIKFFDRKHGYLVGDDGLIYSYLDTTIVPVELINFEVKATENQIVIHWTTASELNNKGFEIQRKSFTTDWNAIGFVNGSGTTTNYTEYSFTDTSPKNGKNFYRLKQIDYDGSITYSEIISIDFSPLSIFRLYPNFPNPFNSHTIINFNLPYDSNIELKIFNILGEQADKLIFENLSAGLNKINYSAESLNSGVYFYKISNGEKALIGKMLLIK